MLCVIFIFFGVNFFFFDKKASVSGEYIYVYTLLVHRCMYIYKNKPTKCGGIKGKNSNRWVQDLWDESASLYGPLSVYIIIPGTGYTYLYKEGFTCNDDVSSMVSLWLIATLSAISWSAENSCNVCTVYVLHICRNIFVYV